jgi:hypothetical protein
MPVLVSLLELVAAEGTRALWPAEFRGFVEAIEAVPEERAGWGVAAEWCDSHDERGLGRAFRYVFKRPEIVVEKTNYGWWYLRGVPYVVSRPEVAKVDRNSVAGAVAELAMQIEAALRELE